MWQKLNFFVQKDLLPIFYGVIRLLCDLAANLDTPLLNP